MEITSTPLQRKTALSLYWSNITQQRNSKFGSINISFFTSIPKKQLEAWYKIPGLNTSCEKKEATVAVLSADYSGPRPSLTSKEAISASEKEYICPICNDFYMDDNMWVCCDNPNCQLSLSRDGWLQPVIWLPSKPVVLFIHITGLLRLNLTLDLPRLVRAGTGFRPVRRPGPTEGDLMVRIT